MYVCMYVCLLAVDGLSGSGLWMDRDSLGWSTLTKLSVSVWCCVVFIVLYCTIYYSGVVGKVLVMVVLWWWFYGGFVLWWFYGGFV